jgi:ASC-1-like (ASCH) protein
VESKVEEEADSIETKIDEIVTAYNNGQEIIYQMVAIQLETIIGTDENN